MNTLPTLSASQRLFASRYVLGNKKPGICALCKGELYSPRRVQEVIKPTFTNLDLLYGDNVCSACAWFLDGKNQDLQSILGRDKPQRAVNYSHLLASGVWYIFSKSQKREMANLLLMEIPEVAVIAVSGQKHLVFRAYTNPRGAQRGYVQYEDTLLDVSVRDFRLIYEKAHALYQAGHTKRSILSGGYNFYINTDLDLWRNCESDLQLWRGTGLFDLTIYLITKEEQANNG